MLTDLTQQGHRTAEKRMELFLPVSLLFWIFYTAHLI